VENKLYIFVGVLTHYSGDEHFMTFVNLVSAKLNEWIHIRQSNQTMCSGYDISFSFLEATSSNNITHISPEGYGISIILFVHVYYTVLI